MIASVGLDKKLYTYETPFSSLAFRDDDLVLAAGTSSGRVVFYDARGKPQPFTVLRAYGSSEVDFSSCYQCLNISYGLYVVSYQSINYL